MIDREKVEKGLRICTSKEPCNGCPYLNERNCSLSMVADALALLEEQEPILLENQHKPYGISTNANSPWVSRCPKCGKKVEGKQTRFCKYCGQAVKWDG